MNFNNTCKIMLNKFTKKFGKNIYTSIKYNISNKTPEGNVNLTDTPNIGTKSMPDLSNAQAVPNTAKDTPELEPKQKPGSMNINQEDMKVANTKDVEPDTINTNSRGNTWYIPNEGSGFGTKASGLGANMATSSGVGHSTEDTTSGKVDKNLTGHRGAGYSSFSEMAGADYNKTQNESRKDKNAHETFEKAKTMANEVKDKLTEKLSKIIGNKIDDTKYSEKIKDAYNRANNRLDEKVDNWTEQNDKTKH
jgi:hypothetical protein